MSGEETPSKITVSRDALRADLAEMELRLRVWIGEQLDAKADGKALAALAERTDALEASVRSFQAGTLTDAQTRSLQIMMSTTLKSESDVGWTGRQRWMAVVAFAVSVISVCATVYIATRSGGAHVK